MTSNDHREYSPNGSYFPFQFERCGVISVLNNSIEYSDLFFECVLEDISTCYYKWHDIFFTLELFLCDCHVLDCVNSQIMICPLKW